MPSFMRCEQTREILTPDHIDGCPACQLRMTNLLKQLRDTGMSEERIREVLEMDLMEC